MERLLAAGSDVNAADSEGCTPLIRAVMVGSGWCARRLLEAYVGAAAI